MYLVEKQLSPLLPPQIHFLDGHLAAGILFQGNAHDSGGAFSNLDEAVQIIARISRTDDHLKCGTELFVSQTLLLLLLSCGSNSSSGGRSSSSCGAILAHRVEHILILVSAGVVIDSVAGRGPGLRAQFRRRCRSRRRRSHKSSSSSGLRIYSWWSISRLLWCWS